MPPPEEVGEPFEGLHRDRLGRMTVRWYETVTRPAWKARPETVHCRRVERRKTRKPTPGDLDELDLIVDHEVPPTDMCEHCGAIEHLEEHHWAPRHMFDDPDSWPRSMLCRHCHTTWHARVTPVMRRDDDPQP